MDPERKLKEWIHKDITENIALVNALGVDEAIEEKQENSHVLLPKFRIEGKTKNTGKKIKAKVVPSILDSEIQEMEKMLQEIDLIKSQNKKIIHSNEKLKISNAKSYKMLLEDRQLLEQMRIDAKNSQIDHLKQLEEIHNAKRKEMIESARSKHAQAEITKQRLLLEDNLKDLSDEVVQLERKLTELRAKRSQEKKEIEVQIAKLKKENTNLKNELVQIEKKNEHNAHEIHQ